MSLATVNRAATIVLAAAGTMLMSAPAAMAATYDCNTPGHTLSVVIDWFEVQQGDLVGYHWGGVICSNLPVDGVFQQCAR